MKEKVSERGSFDKKIYCEYIEISENSESLKYLLDNSEKYPEFKKWEHVLQTSKKDDLSDCFLQGIWFLQNKKLIC